MNYTGTFIRQLPSGGYKAYIWGQPNNHIMDWNGANYRQKVIPNQPLFGYKTKEEALQAIIDFNPEERGMEKWAIKVGDGTFLKEEWARDWLDVDFRTKNKWQIIERKKRS